MVDQRQGAGGIGRNERGDIGPKNGGGNRGGPNKNQGPFANPPTTTAQIRNQNILDANANIKNSFGENLLDSRGNLVAAGGVLDRFNERRKQQAAQQKALQETAVQNLQRKAPRQYAGYTPSQQEIGTEVFGMFQKRNQLLAKKNKSSSDLNELGQLNSLFAEGGNEREGMGVLEGLTYNFTSDEFKEDFENLKNNPLVNFAGMAMGSPLAFAKTIGSGLYEGITNPLDTASRGLEGLGSFFQNIEFGGAGSGYQGDPDRGGNNRQMSQVPMIPYAGEQMTMLDPKEETEEVEEDPFGYNINYFDEMQPLAGGGIAGLKNSFNPMTDQPNPFTMRYGGLM